MRTIVAVLIGLTIVVSVAAMLVAIADAQGQDIFTYDHAPTWQEQGLEVFSLEGLGARCIIARNHMGMAKGSVAISCGHHRTYEGPLRRTRIYE